MERTEDFGGIVQVATPETAFKEDAFHGFTGFEAKGIYGVGGNFKG
jgi:hypothetical protein